MFMFQLDLNNIFLALYSICQMFYGVTPYSAAGKQNTQALFGS